MKSPVHQAFRCLRVWRDLAQRQPGLFPWSDCSLQIARVLLPGRISYRSACRAFANEVLATPEEDGSYRIDVLGRHLSFFWPEKPDHYVHYIIDQEFNGANPHCYTTPPIELGAESVVLDVGACEGLFPFRVACELGVKRVICFEPVAKLAALIRRGAEYNRVADRITIETLAVGRKSGLVGLREADSAQASQVTPAGARGAISIDSVSIDDYCAAKGLSLGRQDLIKIDAEGCDFDVVMGAERVIREGAPQIAVTTYHTEAHAREIVSWLKAVQPAYRMRLKGFSFWTDTPHPVLLQASAVSTRTSSSRRVK